MNQEDQEIAKTILQQIGGRRFIVMTGAKNFIYNAEKRQLQFNISGTKNKCNRIFIALNDMDLYDMSFWIITKKTCKEIDISKNLYHDQLEAEFTNKTGLYTSL